MRNEEYDPTLLRAIPDEVLERDYGCGDPSRWLRRGETVLDLGSGSGKICFIASQVVGPKGRVIGVDMNDEMLALARRGAPEVARRVGYANVSFAKGRIQDLALDLEEVDRALRANPVRSAGDLGRLDAETARLRRERPLVAAGSVDVVVSNCVLNLVRPEEKRQLFSEIFRVLRRGGRAVISDIVLEGRLPEVVERDLMAYVGCISGALQRAEYFALAEKAGLGIEVLQDVDYGASVAASAPGEVDDLLARLGVRKQDVVGKVRSITFRALKKG